MATNVPISNLKKDTQNKLVTLMRNTNDNFMGIWNIRQRLEEIDRVYSREQDRTEETLKASVANRAGDPTKFRNIQVPVVYSSVESATTYQTSVFLTGVPLFGVSSSAVNMDAALQMETIIDDQAIRGGWVRQLQMMFRDGFKYNFAACEVIWTRKKMFTPETSADSTQTQASLEETFWEGNTVKRLDMYNTFWDTRYPVAEVPEKGEFAGYTELMSRSEFIKYSYSLPVKMNYKDACESGNAQAGVALPSLYYIPQINVDSLVDPVSSVQGGINWLAWAGLPIGKNQVKMNDTYTVTTLYARIVPADFGINAPAPHMPQVWKFVFVNAQVLLYAERQTSAHDRLPILFIQPNEDGLNYQSKSLAKNAQDFQAVSSALVNSAIAARRRAVSDRGLYDPSRVDAKHINSDSPSAKIPVRPAAYGQPLSNAYYQIPFRDEQSQQSMGDMQVMMALNEQAIGLNKAQQGQFVKGNKTLFEYQDIAAAANARPQAVSMLLEAQFFTPLKEMLKLNVLQYQAPGEVFNRETETEVTIDPVILRKSNLLFKISDGLVPASKQMNSESFAASTQLIMSAPQVASGYNITPMLSYLFKSQRADVAQFEKSPQLIQYEQAMSSWQQAVATFAEAYSKLKKADGASYTPEEIQKQLPPQPLPEQFGVDPNNPYAPPPKPTGTILSQVAQKEQQNGAA